MIRLNDCYKTVIDESKFVAYNKDETDGIDVILTNKVLYAQYNSQELRDKDIELLDKIFDVKSIEDKVNEEKPSYDFREPQVMNPKPTKEEKYVTWEEVKNSKKKIKVKMPNGDNRFIFCNDGDIVIARNEYREGRIYEEDLFNSLMLKKLE